jgi:hypothetical protein
MIGTLKNNGRARPDGIRAWIESPSLKSADCRLFPRRSMVPTCFALARVSKRETKQAKHAV